MLETVSEPIRTPLPQKYVSDLGNIQQNDFFISISDRAWYPAKVSDNCRMLKSQVFSWDLRRFRTFVSSLSLLQWKVSRKESWAFSNPNESISSRDHSYPVPLMPLKTGWKPAKTFITSSEICLHFIEAFLPSLSFCSQNLFQKAMGHRTTSTRILSFSISPPISIHLATNIWNHYIFRY